jgi:hypothetical protein
MKLKNKPRRLSRPRKICQQKPNSFWYTVPLTAAIQCDKLTLHQGKPKKESCIDQHACLELVVEVGEVDEEDGVGGGGGGQPPPHPLHHHHQLLVPHRLHPTHTLSTHVIIHCKLI